MITFIRKLRRRLAYLILDHSDKCRVSDGLANAHTYVDRRDISRRLYVGRLLRDMERTK